MPNDSTKHRTFSTHPKHSQPAKSPEVKANFTPAEFLIDTNILPLVLIGKGVKSFGWSAVLAFLLGGLSVYGYAVAVKPLPFAKMEMPPPLAPAPAPAHQAKTVRLRGVVRDANLRPVTERFWVGVLANQLGPVQNPEGSFVLEVPESSSYDVALWTSQESVSFYNRMPAEQDDKGLKLQDALPFLAPMHTAELSRGRQPNPRTRSEIARAFDAQ
jgi:hypothetical protein